MEIMLQTVEAIRERRVRNEDLQQRRYVNQRMLIDDARRLVDKKSDQLKTVAEIAALIGGFAMVVLVETGLQEDETVSKNQALMFAFGTITSVVVGLMLLAVILCTLMLVTVLNFNCSQSIVDNSLPFEVFWATRCENDFQFAFTCFKLAIPAFVFSLVCLAWIKFYHAIATAMGISVIAGVVLIIWFCKALPQWGKGDGQGIGADNIYSNEPSVSMNHQEDYGAMMPPSTPDSTAVSLHPRGSEEVEEKLDPVEEDLTPMQ